MMQEAVKTPSKKCRTCYGSGTFRQRTGILYEARPDCPDCVAGRVCRGHRRREEWQTRECGCLREEKA